MRSLLKSFKFALRGIVYCINNERNMRIHTVAAVLVMLFSLFFELSRLEYAVLFITIAVVMSAEMVNTAVEELTDLSSEAYNPMARISKDVAAGAVIISAVFAVLIGIAIFWKPDKFMLILAFFLQNPWMILLFAIFLIIACMYISLGPIGLKELFRRKKSK